MILKRDTILSCLWETGLDDESLREDYFGRAMYGDSCMGIVCNEDGDILEFARFITQAWIDDEIENINWLRNVITDAMGLQSIWYWPGVTVE